ncbi:hypothetical protein VPH35_140185 [Triticum aestivum]
MAICFGLFRIRDGDKRAGSISATLAAWRGGVGALLLGSSGGTLRLWPMRQGSYGGTVAAGIIEVKLPTPLNTSGGNPRSADRMLAASMCLTPLGAAFLECDPSQNKKNFKYKTICLIDRIKRLNHQGSDGSSLEIRMMGETTVAVAWLPGDVVQEIFMRIKDVADLFRCAMTCKQWRRIVLNPSFLRRRQWPNHTSSFLSGFFIWEKLIFGRGSTALTSFIPTPRSVFSSDHWFLETFFSRATRARLENAVPLVARHGLLLVRLVSSNSIVRLAVCNLLVGACDELPPLKCNWDFEKSGYAILTKADCSSNAKHGYSAFFKVLIIGTDRDHRPHKLHKFMSGEARWSSPTDLFVSTNKRMTGWLPLRDPRAVVCHGTAHWLICYVTGQDWRLHSIEIAIPAKHKTTEHYDEPQLIVHASEKLSLLYLDRQDFKLETWTRQEDPTMWLRTMVVELKPPRPTMMDMDLSILGEKGGMLLIKDNHMNLYAADFETGAMVKLTRFDNVNRPKVVPLEMDWVAFFVSRLGGGLRSKKPSS